MRKGISLSLTYVVIGLILLTTAVTVIMYFTGSIDTVERIVGNSFGQSEQQIIENQCLNQKSQACQGCGTGGDGSCWLENASYNGQSCNDFINPSEVSGCQ